MRSRKQHTHSSSRHAATCVHTLLHACAAHLPSAKLSTLKRLSKQQQIAVKRTEKRTAATAEVCAQDSIPQPTRRISSPRVVQVCTTWVNLPPELMVTVLQHFDLQTLCVVACVCSTWRTAVDSCDSAWHRYQAWLPPCQRTAKPRFDVLSHLVPRVYPSRCLCRPAHTPPMQACRPVHPRSCRGVCGALVTTA